MNAADALQAGAFVLVVALLVKPVGAYLERVFERRHTLLDPLLLPAERLIHRLVGIDPKCEMDWKRYAVRLHSLWRSQRGDRLFSASLAGVVALVFSESNDYADDAGSCRQYGSQFCNHDHVASLRR